MIDTKEMKVIKEGVIDDDFRNWMETNFGNWEDGNLLIQLDMGGKQRGKICCYDSEEKDISVMDEYSFSPFSCKSWKLLFDGKFHFLLFSYVIYDDEFWYSSEYHTEQLFKIIGTNNNFNEKVSFFA